MSGISDLFTELRRRSIFKIATAYAVTAWLLLQLASILLPTFMAPSWVMQGVTVLIALGFPIALVLTWIFEITPQGIVRDEETGETSTGDGTSGRIFDFAIIGVLLIAVSLFAYDKFVIKEQEVADARRRPAIAVLPFVTDRDDTDSRLLADGIATELIARLSSWPSFPVIARAASFIPGLGEDIFAAGEKLDARYFVTGNLRSSSENIRVNVSITDSTNGRTVWSDSFDRQFADLLNLEEDISRTIVGQINPALLARESERAMRADPNNLDAWEAAHRGWWYVSTETQEGYDEANEWFDRSIELDPNWGWPYAAKALVIYRSYLNGWAPRTDESKQQLFKFADKAVRFDPRDAFAHHALGHAYGVINRTEESVIALARGVELNPSDAMAQACYGMQLAAANRPADAINAVEHAMTLSPEDPWMHWFTLVLARAYFAAEDYEFAEQWALRSNLLKPNFGALIHSISAAAQAGKLEIARQRVIDARAMRALPPLDALEKNFNTHTESEYTARLMDGLRMADFDTAGTDQDVTL